MSKKIFVTPEYTTAEEIKNVRKKLGLTQKEFAELLGSSKSTVERWETSASHIRGPLVLLLQLLEKEQNYVEKMKVPPKVYPIRLWYMHKQTICTLIDVDEINQKIQIKNYTDNIMFRAFGRTENPDYHQYMEFLESRCFPRTRDKMKLILRDLDLPFYDPFMIIEKTEGRMAEDDFWIRIER